jgi:hypothetical protein
MRKCNWVSVCVDNCTNLALSDVNQSAIWGKVEQIYTSLFSYNCISAKKVQNATHTPSPSLRLHFHQFNGSIRSIDL